MAQKVLPVGTDLEEIPSIRDLAVDVDVAMAAIGTTADAPDTAVNEDATPRTGVSLWKGAKNFLRWIYMSVGLLADAPASNTVPEDVTARSGISLWKAIKNILALMNAKLPAALGQGTMAQSLTVTMASNQSPIVVRGAGISRAGTITRPADTTQYTAGDVVTSAVAAALQFDVARAAGAAVWVNNFVLTSTNVPAATGAFWAWLFTAAPTVAADNAAFAPSDAEMLTCAGRLMLDHAQKTGANTHYQPSVLRPTYIVCAAADTKLYVVITDINAYTPANAEVFTATMHVCQD
jgi:hypothetical protein